MKRKPQKIIIDGYNVIHAVDELKQYATYDLERSRTALLEHLKTYLEGKALHVTVVFDGSGGLTDTESVLPAKLQVLFSRFDQSADDLIIRTLRDSPNPREFIVVTSDAMDIGRKAKALGAQVVASNNFFERISRKNQGDKRSKKEKPAPSKEDTAFWLDMFSSEEN